MPVIANMHFEAGSDRTPIQGTDFSSREHPPQAWRCWICQHDAFVWSTDDWVCEQCGSMGYYDAAASLRRETDDGVWIFMPKHGNSIYDPFSSVKWRGSRLTVKRFLYGFGTVQPGDFIENSGFCDFIAKLHVSAILVGGVKASHFIEAKWWVMVFVFHFLHVKKRWGRPYQKNLPVTQSPKISLSQILCISHFG